jgi:hypothetical protein
LQGANNLFMSGLNMAGGSLMSLGRNIGAGGSSGGGQSGGGSQQPASSSGGQQEESTGGGDAYGGSNLGYGGYTPIMLNSGMGGPSPQNPTNDQEVFLNHNTNTWQP